MGGLLLLSALLQLLLAVLFIYLAYGDLRARRQFSQRMGTVSRVSGGGVMRGIGGSSLGRRTLSMDSETVQLLNRLGWRKRNQQSMFSAIQLGTPIVLLLLVVIVELLLNKAPQPIWLAPVFALGIGYLIPKRWLAMAARRRQEQLAEEVTTFIPLLRILFDVGMTVEQGLRVLAKESEGILPNLSAELRQVLARVDAGLELGRELRDMAALLEVYEVTDCVVILEQLIVQGGGAMASLLRLKELIDDRHHTALEERVSKLSGKMSVIMMIFLFPALLIVLAGPGFIAIVGALGELK
ncbi:MULTISPECIES: type II secretion system F family protein [Pseudomonas]|uniref:Type II secretion system protein F n=2 Tax=Pseudomonadaceae TaxID=135621 RepID=A0A0D0KDT1_9PSED|nr:MULTISPECIES: type II secretion system F family protein [Pseudomonas]KIP96254.1 type II secretion system protein F [Pseudomonas fulva]MCW2289966.1 tight adherence protein C [Pseudomonas sp. BIGb0408]NYH75460.1 tight adherence protein C [Pseudomonas flavescens]